MIRASGRALASPSADASAMELKPSTARHAVTATEVAAAAQAGMTVFKAVLKEIFGTKDVERRFGLRMVREAKHRACRAPG